MRDQNLRQEPGGRRDDTCDHGSSRIQKLESRSVQKKKKKDVFKKIGTSGLDHYFNF